MLTSRPSTARRSRPSALAASLLLLAAAAFVGCSAPPAATSTDPITVTVPTTSSAKGLNVSVPDSPPGQPAGGHRGALGVNDGRLPDDVTLFDSEYPGVANLSPDLLGALRSAATEARRDGITITLNSGWRSAAYQEQLLEDAVSEYGSRAEAARWVATPKTSPHVSGEAVDVDGSRATDWLEDHGARFGLCQVFRNEPWHFELRPSAVDHGCPRQSPDPTQDPRMQR